jgi:hypothetical protein
MWIMAIAEMAYLYVEDLTVFARRRVQFGPKRNRTIDDISDEDCYTWFGIADRDDMRILIRHLRIPQFLGHLHMGHTMGSTSRCTRCSWATMAAR